MGDIIMKTKITLGKSVNGKVWRSVDSSVYWLVSDSVDNSMYNSMYSSVCRPVSDSIHNSTILAAHIKIKSLYL